MVNSLSSTQMIWVRFLLPHKILKKPFQRSSSKGPYPSESVYSRKQFMLTGEIGKHDRLKICSLYGYRFKSDSKHIQQSKACSCSWNMLTNKYCVWQHELRFCEGCPKVWSSFWPWRRLKLNKPNCVKMLKNLPTKQENKTWKEKISIFLPCSSQETHVTLVWKTPHILSCIFI